MTANVANKVRPGQGPKEPVKVFKRDSASSYGAWRNVAVVIGHAPPTVASIQNYRDLVENLAEQYPAGIAMLTIVTRTSTPEPKARDALVSMFRVLWPRILGAGFVVEARGFAAATQRAIGSTLVRVIGIGGRVLIEQEMSPVTSWIAARLSASSEAKSETVLAALLLDAAQAFSLEERTIFAEQSRAGTA